MTTTAKKAIITGFFSVVVALIGIVSALVGRATMTVNVSVDGSTQDISVDSLQSIYLETKTELESLRVENVALETRLAGVQGEAQECPTVASSVSEAVCSVAESSGAECDSVRTCIADENFEVRLTYLSRKGQIVNVSVLVKNVTDEEIEMSFFREYVALTGPTGERQAKTTNRFRVMVEPGQVHSFAYDFEFEEAVEGGTFNFLMQIEKPTSSFAFVDIPAI